MKLVNSKLIIGYLMKSDACVILWFIILDLSNIFLEKYVKLVT